MRNKGSKSKTNNPLRQKAEELLKTKSNENVLAFSDVETIKLIHELEVHQIELEMQNDELIGARTELESLLEKYTELYDFAPTGYLTLSEKSEITELNLRASQMIGKERSFLINKRFAVFVTESTKQIFNQFLQNVFDGKINERCEIALQVDDKLFVDVLLTGVKSENNKFCLVAMTNITDLKRASQEIELKNKQLQELNFNKDKFFSIIAHDLKSPFQGFLGMLRMMSEETDSFNKTDITKFCNAIYHSADNLYKLLENLLLWSQIQKGIISFKPEEQNIYDIFVQNIDAVNDRVIQKGIVIINEVPKNQTVYADEKMLNSILRNLLSNAVKFTKKGGSITVRTKQIESQFLEISVSDTGIGIPEALSLELFNFGERTGRRGTEGEESTGLGLVLCSEFVQKHGGKIWSESKENMGSTFKFTLPMETSKQTKL